MLEGDAPEVQAETPGGVCCEEGEFERSDFGVKGFELWGVSCMLGGEGGEGRYAGEFRHCG